MRIIGVPNEPMDEARVAATPGTVESLVAQGARVLVARGAGSRSHMVDAAYAIAGAELVDDATVWAESDVLLKVGRPSAEEVAAMKPDAAVLCWFDGDETHPIPQAIAARGGTLIAVEAVPRITRAQRMDVRSSMAGLAGYRAVVEASSHLGRTFTGQVTAAGSSPPVKVLVIGAGVAGLAAVSAARSLGAIVRAFDTREAAREQVTSLGAEFLEVHLDESGDGQGGYAKVMSAAFIEAEHALFREHAPHLDVVITTAAIPGRKAPVLWLEDMVELMPEGSVIIDIASATGGNCALTEDGRTVVHHGVTIVGASDLPRKLAPQASSLYANNLLSLLDLLGLVARDTLDHDDPIVQGVTVVDHGTVRWPAPPPPQPDPPAPRKEAPPRPPPPVPVAVVPPKVAIGALVIALSVLLGAGLFAPMPFLQHLTVFALACIVGWLVVWNVNPALHTPLMSVTNAISGIIVVGGILTLGSDVPAARTLGLASVAFAAFNIFGGFGVTERMLAMFHRGGEA